MSTPDRRALVDRGHGELSVRRQCQLLGLARSGIYRLRPAANDDDDPALLRRIDELFTTWPFLGSRRMTAMLRAEGHAVNRKRVQRLMRRIGIAALGPKPRTTKSAPGHKIFPYLLRGLAIDWRGGCRTPWTSRSAATRSRRRSFASAPRRSSTPTRVASSPAQPSPACWRQPAFASRWTAGAVGWTMCSSSDCGARSSMRISTSKATPTAARLMPGSLHGSRFTTPCTPTKPWPIARRWRCGTKAWPPVWPPELALFTGCRTARCHDA